MQMMVWGEPPRPPATPVGAVVVVVVPISTGGLCWKTLEMLGTGRRWHGKDHITPIAVPRRCLLQHFGLLHCDKEEGRSPLAVNRVSRPRCHTADPLCHSGAPCTEQDGEEHPWVVKRVASVQHLVGNPLVATETRHSASRLWALCALGRREGFAATQLQTPLPLPPRRQRHAPDEAASSSLLPADVDTQERSMGWDLLQGAAPRAESPSPMLGATRT